MAYCPPLAFPRTSRTSVGAGRTVVVKLVPFDLVSDLNNDGKVSDADRSLRDKALKSGASDKDKEKGTEYIFANDKLSNGAWDVQDQGALAFSYPSQTTLPKPPASEKNDDDAQELQVIVGATFGKVYFDHPAINDLQFYKTKECKPEDKINIKFESPYDLTQGPVPNPIYVRVENEDTNALLESTGDLRLFLTKTSPSDILAETKLPFTVVRRFGATHFFNAARDYIFENNTKVFIRDHGYPFGANPDVVFRICVMREEATTLAPLDAYTANKKGVEEAASAMGSPTVVINGNQCFFETGLKEDDPNDWPQMIGYIADSCHGRVIVGSTLAPISSDNYYTTTEPAPGSPLAGPDPIPETGEPGGKFVAKSSNTWTFAAGRASGANALGGLSTYYDRPDRADKKHQMIGFAKGTETGKGCVFTATEIKGEGLAPTFKNGASLSGVEALSPSADGGAIKLFIMDSGDGSLGLMHVDPSGTLRSAYIGRKSKIGFPYYVSDYLGFNATVPRPTPAP